MRNVQVFQDFDMVVSITQKALNDQLLLLVKAGVINLNLVIQQTTDKDDNYVYQVYESMDDVPMDESDPDVPADATLNASIIPSVEIAASGTDINFVLTFRTGTAWFWVIKGRQASLKQYDVTGWKWVVPINLDLKAVEKATINTDPGVPENVKRQINDFQDNMFSVNSLFMNFESTNLLNVNTAKSSGGSDSSMSDLTNFLQFYLTYLQKTGNPYVLGYSITAGPATTYDVADTMKPVGTTFSLYYDPVNPDLSNLNFVLATKGLHGATTGIVSSPDNFDTNWFNPDESCQGKMIYGANAFTEEFILKPFYNSLGQNMLDRLHAQQIYPNGYNSVPAYSHVATSTGFKFTLANVTSGNNQYTNNYTVDITNDSVKAQVNLKFAGTIYVYSKQVKKEVGCDAEAWGKSTTVWSGNVSIITVKDSTGAPGLKVTSQSFVTDPSRSSSSHDQNACASAYSWIGDFLGAFLDAFTFGLDNDYFTDIFNDIFDVKIPGLVKVNSNDFANLSNNVNSVVLLPAGQVFFFSDPTMDNLGNMSIELEYKSDFTTDSARVSQKKSVPVSAENPRGTKAPQAFKRERGSFKGDPQAAKEKIKKAAKKCCTSNTPWHREAPAKKLQLVAEPAAKTSTKTGPPAPNGAYTVPTDTLVLNGAGSLQGSPLKFEITCEMMKNQKQASPVATNESLLVVQDKQQNPLFFSIGDDSQLYLIKTDPNSKTSGNSSVNLLSLGGITADFTAAVSVGVNQDAKGRISIAFAARKDGDSGTTIFAATLLDSDVSDIDKWTTSFKDNLKQISGIDPKFSTSSKGIVLCSTDDDKPLSFIAAGRIDDGDRFFYHISDLSKSAEPLALPENMDRSANALTGITLGNEMGQRGAFFLYKIGETQSLVATTFPDAEMGSNSFDYSPNNINIPSDLKEDYRDLNCIFTCTGTQNDPFNITSDIYVGARSGIFLFKNGKNSGLQRIAKDITDVHEIYVSHDSSNISVWAISNPSNLYYIAGKKSGSQYVWAEPLLFKKNVIHFAPLRTSKKKTNEVYTLTQDGSISHYWQDPATTVWQSQVMKIGQLGYVMDFNSFTIQINGKTNDTGCILSGQQLRITSSDWVYATINGLVYSLDRDNAATVPFDITGNITIICEANTLSCPVFHIESDFTDKVVNVYPFSHIFQTLKKNTATGDLLQNAYDQFGQGVIDGDFDQVTLDSMSAALAQVSDVVSENCVDPKSGYTFIVVSDQKASSKISAKKAVPDTGVALAFSKSTIGAARYSPSFKVEPMNNAQSAKMATSVGSAIKCAAGDVLNFLDNVITTGLKYIEKGVIYLEEGFQVVLQAIEEGLNFVVQLGEKVYSFIVDSLQIAFQALGFLLKLITVDIGKLIKWIGSLFSWQDIWDTHKTIAIALTNGLNYGVESAEVKIQGVSDSLMKALDSVSDSIKSLVIPGDYGSKSPTVESNTYAEENSKSVSSRPSSNYMQYHSMHSDLLAPSEDQPEQKSSGSNPISQFYNDILVPTLSAIETTMQKVASDLGALLKDPLHGTVDKISQLISDAIDAVIEPLKAIIAGILDFVVDLMKDIQKLLLAPLDIPFLGSLYSWLAGLAGDKEDFTLINAAALVLAVPLNFVFQLSTGKTLKESGGYILEDPNFFETVFGPVKLAKSEGSARAKAKIDSNDVKRMYSSFGGVIGSEAGMFSIIYSVLQSVGSTQALRRVMGGFNTFFVAVRQAFTFPISVPGRKNYSNDFKLDVWIYKSLLGLIVNFIYTVANVNRQTTTIYTGTMVCATSVICTGMALIADCSNLKNEDKELADSLVLIADLCVNAGAATASGVSMLPKTPSVIALTAMGLTSCLSGAVILGGLSLANSVKTVIDLS